VSGYRYRGTQVDEPGPVPRRAPGLRRASMQTRVLAALAGLGGNASTTQIRAALEASGEPLDPRRVPDALHRLAAMSPPRVTAAGDRRGGRGKTQTWRRVT
jgi:hypothetical protein